MRHDSALEVVRIQGMRSQLRHTISDASAVGEARRGAQVLAQSLHLDETIAGRVSIVVTELGNNLMRHAGGGLLLIQHVRAVDGGDQIEVLSLDSGPGMTSIDQCLQDGYSTGGTSGTGLGAVRRLASLFDVYSIAGRGCVVLARVGAGQTAAFGGVSTAVRGETVCGDCWRLAMERGRFAALVMDGLGHGENAAAAATIAADAFVASPYDAPEVTMERVHARLSGTRGAAGACVLRTEEARLRFTGVGNISVRAFGSGVSQGMPSHNGILGAQVRRIQPFEYDARHHPLLIMHTDGISSRWDLDQYEGLRVRHPAIIAGVLYRDHRRVRDDATILVVRHE